MKWKHLTAKRWVLVGVVAAFLFFCAASVLDFESALVNTLTEGVGVLVGTILTVSIIERRRRVSDEREAATRWRARIRDELSHNLAQFLRREGTYALPAHQTLKLSRDTFRLSVRDIPGRYAITQEQARGLLFAGPFLTGLRDLRRVAIDDVLSTGFFVRSVGGELESQPMHRALVTVRDDLDGYTRQLNGLRQSSILTADWHARLLVAARDAIMNGDGEVDAYALLVMLGCYDRFEDLFQSLIVALRLLEGVSVGSEAPRRPTSPLGERESHNIFAEQVTADEVLELLRRDVSPIGTRPPCVSVR